MIDELLPQAERIAARLKARGETISIAESSTAGLISAALLAIAGASAYFMGGAVVYTRQSRTALLEVTEQELTGITPSTEAYALLFARKIRGKLATTWAVGVAGLDRDRSLAAGPDDGDAGMPGGVPVAAAGRAGGAGFADRPACLELAADLAGEEQRVGLGRGSDAGQFLLGHGE
ncbi:MAG: CinA family protein [Stellaceae bacterium]